MGIIQYTYEGNMKLISKLIKIEPKTIEDVEALKEKLYKDEYVSFSSMIRRLIRIGLDTFKTDGENK